MKVIQSYADVSALPTFNGGECQTVCVVPGGWDGRTLMCWTKDQDSNLGLDTSSFC